MNVTFRRHSREVVLATKAKHSFAANRTAQPQASSPVLATSADVDGTNRLELSVLFAILFSDTDCHRFRVFFRAEIAVPIPLAVWQDPQGDLTLNHTSELCEVLFNCWDESGEPADYSYAIKFQHAWAVRGVCMESTPYKFKEHLRSCIYEIENSRWLDELSKMRVACYPRWKDWDKRIYKHFLVTGHDNYYEIIATGFDEEKIFD